MKSNILFLFVFLISFIVNGQVNVYQDYQFEGNNGVIIESLKNNGNTTMVLSTDTEGKLILVELKTIKELQKSIIELQNQIADLKTIINNISKEGVQDDLFEVNIFPNPSKTIFNLEFSKIIPDFVTVNSVKGIQISNIPINSKSIVLDLNSFPKGIYYLNFIHKNENIGEKIIVFE